MGKLVNIAGGVGLGVCLSQFPEYSQQYVQRLGGAVEELTTVVADFDASAKDAGLDRTQALNRLTGDQFLENRNQDMTRTIDRQERLSESYAMLKEANAFQRLGAIRRFGDAKVTAGAWADFQPAIPLNIESLVLLLGGYSLGYLGVSGLGRGTRRIRNGIEGARFRKKQAGQRYL